MNVDTILDHVESRSKAQRIKYEKNSTAFQNPTSGGTEFGQAKWHQAAVELQFCASF